jgi:hypothetical protein
MLRCAASFPVFRRGWLIAAYLYGRLMPRDFFASARMLSHNPSDRDPVCAPCLRTFYETIAFLNFLQVHQGSSNIILYIFGETVKEQIYYLMVL